MGVGGVAVSSRSAHRDHTTTTTSHNNNGVSSSVSDTVATTEQSSMIGGAIGNSANHPSSGNMNLSFPGLGLAQGMIELLNEGESALTSLHLFIIV